MDQRSNPDTLSGANPEHPAAPINAPTSSAADRHIADAPRMDVISGSTVTSAAVVKVVRDKGIRCRYDDRICLLVRTDVPFYIEYSDGEVRDVAPRDFLAVEDDPSIAILETSEVVGIATAEGPVDDIFTHIVQRGGRDLGNDERPANQKPVE
jgi:hypothetical protein